MNWTLPSWIVLYTTIPHPATIFPKGARKWAVMGKDNWAPTALISEVITEPHLPSKEPNRLKLAFVDVKAKILDHPGPPFSM
ncbi:hypothetical protein AVEN_212997-1 [Araneus ventricosus]|uniref:Uncharacterized protein n=1 Tax=Araneus ventricosus TaxID=182803 RepID=A0A4Y2LBA2_ARAVE|nr:hypothetical protein AVEN_212997-1 [Araneus ventricosus]